MFTPQNILYSCIISSIITTGCFIIKKIISLCPNHEPVVPPDPIIQIQEILPNPKSIRKKILSAIIFIIKFLKPIIFKLVAG